MSAGRSRPRALLPAAGRGAVAGLLGVAVMTAGEKAEQAFTHRDDSYVPGRTLQTLLGRHPRSDDRSPVWNHLMHWGTGALVGTLRGVWSAVGIRGSRASAVHTVVRLAVDQTLENTSGAGAPPATWPVREQLWDTAHKAVYAFATGLVADRLVPPSLAVRRSPTSH